MKGKEKFKLLIPGIVVGFILGSILTALVGVNSEDAIPNYIGGAMCCLIPTLLNTVIVLKTGSKAVNRNLSVGSAFLRAIPFAIGAGILGFLIVFGLIENVIQISTCDISLGVTIAYQATLGVLVSTLLALVALNKYLSDVKYTKRK